MTGKNIHSDTLYPYQILRTAIRANAPQEEMPSTLYIISDMEFNYAVQNPNETIYENARKQFEKYGYKMPAVVFHNGNITPMDHIQRVLNSERYAAVHA